MANKVNYTNTCGQALYVNFKKMKNEDLTKITPDVFDTDFDGHPVLSLADLIAMVFPGGDVTKKPYFYIRHTDMVKNQFRFGNIVELGDDYLSPQKGAYKVEEFAQGGVAVTPYKADLVGDGQSGFGSTEPFSEFKFNEEYFTAKEGDFFSIKGDFWPNTIFEHQSMYNHVSTIIRAASVIGTLDDKPIMGLGEHDRLFIPEVVKGFDGITNDFGYVYINLMGIRHDGRREQALISLENSGKIFAYYYLDGEIPIMADEVEMEADWVRLPYVDDGTCIFKHATFRFAGKELHFEGKWGSKGFTHHPRVEKNGQSQVFGTWYEGDTPYEHRLFMGFNENMEAYDYKLKAKGFNVLDPEEAE